MGRESLGASPPQGLQHGQGSIPKNTTVADSSHDNQSETPPHQAGVPLRRFPGLTLISTTRKGRGVFASVRIPARSVIEVCPVLVLDPADAGQHISKTSLDHYTYNWPWKSAGEGAVSKTKTQVVVLGLGSMFNHSTRGQNVAWTRDVELECITYTALRDIEVGEELCISYGDGTRLWFEDADADLVDTAEESVDGEFSGLERIETF